MITCCTQAAGRRSLAALCVVLLTLFLLAGCRQDNTAAPTQVVAQATDEPADDATAVPPTEEPATETPASTHTPAPTDTATPVPTDTPEPTDTPTPEPTETPVPTDTPTPTRTAVPQPTVPPALPTTAVTAHTFPETPIQPFDAAVFRSYMGQVRDSFRSFVSEWGLMSEGKLGDCGTFNGWIGLWITQAPGFTDVPANFQPLYVEYRALLRDIVNITGEVRTVCSAYGGTISEETALAIESFLAWAYPRSEEMVTQLNQMPNP